MASGEYDGVGGGAELAYFGIGGGHVGCATTARRADGTASAVSASPQGYSVTVASRSRHDLLAYNVPSTSAAPVLSGIVRTRLRPLALLTVSGFANPYGLAVGTSGKALYVVSNCFSSTGSSVTALTIPSFADGGSAPAYVRLSTAATGTYSVVAITADGLGRGRIRIGRGRCKTLDARRSTP